MYTLINGDCEEKLREMDDNTVDAVVTDPPYGLGFMGKEWDRGVPPVKIWKEILRILKPGGHLLSFGGTRTYHRMVWNIEESGFEIRDQIQWIYGQSMPKSLNISKAINKAKGVKREVVGKNPNHRGESQYNNPYTKAKQWDGFGTALAPANEPIVLARKPISEKTIVNNVIKWGTGGLNIDGCRIETSGEENPSIKRYQSKPQKGNHGWEHKNRGANFDESTKKSMQQGRWPKNVILDESAAEMLDEQSGPCPSASNKKTTISGGIWGSGVIPVYEGGARYRHEKATGASRFFFNSEWSDECEWEAGEKDCANRFIYCAKASRSEKDSGLEQLDDKLFEQGGGAQNAIKRGESEYHTENQSGFNTIKKTKNNHATVKPVKLMRYLCRLITPPGGTVLDPFMGSGSTGIGAIKEGFQFIGIEKEKEYFEIATKRLNHWSREDSQLSL